MGKIQVLGVSRERVSTGRRVKPYIHGVWGTCSGDQSSARRFYPVYNPGSEAGLRLGRTEEMEKVWIWVRVVVVVVVEEVEVVVVVRFKLLYSSSTPRRGASSPRDTRKDWTGVSSGMCAAPMCLSTRGGAAAAVVYKEGGGGGGGGGLPPLLLRSDVGGEGETKTAAKWWPRMCPQQAASRTRALVSQRQVSFQNSSKSEETEVGHSEQSWSGVADRPAGLQTPGPLVSWSPGPLVSWSPGLLVPWSPGLQHRELDDE